MNSNALVSGEPRRGSPGAPTYKLYLNLDQSPATLAAEPIYMLLPKLSLMSVINIIMCNIIIMGRCTVLMGLFVMRRCTILLGLYAMMF